MAARPRPSTGPTRSRSRLWLVLGGLGLAVAVVGLLLVLAGVPAARARSALLDALPVVSPATAADHPDGSRVLLEARVADDAPEVFRDFVAYRRREFRGFKQEDDRSVEVWDAREVVAPALVLEGGGARVSVEPGYEMTVEPHAWRSSERPESSLLGPSTQEVIGFRRGDAVTVEGVLAGSGRTVRSATLAGGTSETYRARERESARTLLIVGFVLFGVGGLFLLVGAIAALRPGAGGGATPGRIPGRRNGGDRG